MHVILSNDRNIKREGITTEICLLYWARWNINVNDILPYRTDYLLRKCHKRGGVVGGGGGSGVKNWKFRPTVLFEWPLSLKYNAIFAKFLEILLDNNVTSLHTHIRWQSKNYSEVIWVYIFRFFIKGIFINLTKMVLKLHWKNSTPLGFRWLTKSIQTTKLHERRFCRCYSLCFCISVV